MFLGSLQISNLVYLFLTRHDREGSHVCHFSLATSSLKLNSSSILTFQVCAVRYCVLGEQ